MTLEVSRTITPSHRKHVSAGTLSPQAQPVTPTINMSVRERRGERGEKGGREREKEREGGRRRRKVMTE